jgi:hypothetical protein
MSTPGDLVRTWKSTNVVFLEHASGLRWEITITGYTAPEPVNKW